MLIGKTMHTTGRMCTTVALALYLATAGASCATSSSVQTGSPALLRDARDVLVGVLRHADDEIARGRRRQGLKVTPFDESRVRIRVDTSGLSTGLQYYWGFYGHPDYADRVVRAVVASSSDQATAIEGPLSWWKAVTQAQARPTGAQEFAAGCAEGITVAGPRADPDDVGLIQADSSELGLLNPVIQGYLRRAQVGPAAVQGSERGGRSEAEVTMWVVERGQTTKYRCSFIGNEFRLRSVDSLPGIGLLPIGP